MNKNTRRARGLGLSGESFKDYEEPQNPKDTSVISKNAQPIVKGKCVDSSFGAKGNNHTTKKDYQKISEDAKRGTFPPGS